MNKTVCPECQGRCITGEVPCDRCRSTGQVTEEPQCPYCGRLSWYCDCHDQGGEGKVPLAKEPVRY